jgi:hypothetical protein
MKGLGKKIESFFTAIAFAEAGEFDTARAVLRDQERSQSVERISPAVRSRKELRAPGIKR